ncbi:MAG: type II toxin-antitoxin system VapC family toxin, partial [Candidatus Obscuribacterales bacterium]|nr:type II toxin-antitoxin system VapC family toxin [Candidatus Obscuribacterales bacterium]
PFDVYDFDTTLCPMHYGKIRYDLESKGVPIGSMDLLIAAQALSLDATLVTNNRKHFGRVSGLNIASWMQTP